MVIFYSQFYEIESYDKKRQTIDNKDIRPFQGRGTSRQAGGGFLKASIHCPSVGLSYEKCPRPNFLVRLLNKKVIALLDCVSNHFSIDKLTSAYRTQPKHNPISRLFVLPGTIPHGVR